MEYHPHHRHHQLMSPMILCARTAGALFRCSLRWTRKGENMLTGQPPSGTSPFLYCPCWVGHLLNLCALSSTDRDFSCTLEPWWCSVLNHLGILANSNGWNCQFWFFLVSHFFSPNASSSHFQPVIFFLKKVLTRIVWHFSAFFFWHTHF